MNFIRVARPLFKKQRPVKHGIRTLLGEGENASCCADKWPRLIKVEHGGCGLDMDVVDSIQKIVVTEVWLASVLSLRGSLSVGG